MPLRRRRETNPNSSSALFRSHPFKGLEVALMPDTWQGSETTTALQALNRARARLWSLIPSVAVAIAVLLAADVSGRAGRRDSTQGDDRSAPLLRGAIDIHVHTDPDNVPRSIDGLDAAKMALASGMRGIVLKNHYDPTAGLAFLARKEAPGLEAFGGIDLNLPVGGMNAAAVEHLTQVAGGWGKVVWMSTFDAENQVRYSKENRPFVSVARDGALLPETKAVITAIARHDLVLATGHTSASEALLLLQEGRRQGVKHMVVTHAMNPPIEMDVAGMRAAVKEGAFIEFVSGGLSEPGAASRLDRYVAAMRLIGPGSCIASSDLGQKGNPLPHVGFAAFVQELQKRGLAASETDRRTKENPAKLLGLRSRQD